MSSGWSCPHNENNLCLRLGKIICQPGIAGCTLGSGAVFAEVPEHLREEITSKKKPSSDPQPKKSFKKGLM